MKRDDRKLKIRGTPEESMEGMPMLVVCCDVQHWKLG